MEPLKTHTGKAAVLNRINVDTDQIIPKQFLKRIERTGYGRLHSLTGDTMRMANQTRNLN